MNYPKHYDVIVVGGGHAGTEAACAAARMGVSTLLLTHNIETIGQMSCNPAIGGIGKGHLVKEIDALDGLMAKAADQAGIQWRTLNSRKGPAVRATRAQADRNLYRSAIRSMVENQENLDIFQSPVTDLLLKGDQVCGVSTKHQIDFYAHCIVITAGTFLGGKIHVGLNGFSGGRAGDPAAIDLAEKLRDLPFDVARLKTGTPPRLDARSVDFSMLTEQAGDIERPVFSYLGNINQHPRQVSCYIAHTNEQTHDIIRQYLDQSPIYSGVIHASGPRYCPSIEDKVMRFSDKNSHQVFIEPESLTTNELYPNGVSTSLPFEAQLKYIHSIKGLENAFITRPGYAIEYDFFNPQGLYHHLESKHIRNLFFAGQVNGTTGYEEAAAQGLLAGLNAALRIKEQDPWYPLRDQAYLGVLVDDLITQGTSEPYRMFTSRAEHRLLLREDNADARLTPIGHQLGLVSQYRYETLCAKLDAIEHTQQQLAQTLVNPKQYPELKQSISAQELLKRPEINYQSLIDFGAISQNPDLKPSVIEQVEIQNKYAGYISRQQLEVEKIQKHQQQKLPIPYDYRQVTSLSAEVAEKLQKVQPENIAQAARISGVTPAAISILLIHFKKHNKDKTQA